LKLIVGRLVPIGGAVKLGTGIKVGYFSQDASMLDAKNIGIDELLAVCKDSTECFRMAAHLHLTEDDMRTKISNLSSGQRIKLEFAKLLLADNNLLILDEPTNHLEISTREEIETALQDYGGAVLVVSHDRYFVEKLGVDRVVEL
jgi:ATP-binding cassette subfamily F protein 3